MGLTADPFTNNRYAFGAGNPITAIELDGHLFGLSLSDIGHAALDVVGMVPVVGVAADVANGVWYAAEGDYVDAGLSFAGAIPVIGNFAVGARYAVKGGKYAVKGAHALEAADDVVKGTRTALRTVHGGQDLVAGARTTTRATRGAAGADKATQQAAHARAAAHARGEATGVAEAQADKVARSCLNSFPGATLVLLGNGTTTPIDSVQVGDWVEATDPDTGKTIAEPVTAVIVTRTDRDYTDTTIATADGHTATVTSTQHHRFYDVTEHAWVRAADLDPGDLFREPDGTWATVTGIRNYHTHTTTYNLTVTTLHTYYVLAGRTPVLVHNSGPCPVWSTRQERAGDVVGKYTEGQSTRDPASQWYHEELSNEELLVDQQCRRRRRNRCIAWRDDSWRASPLGRTPKKDRGSAYRSR